MRFIILGAGLSGLTCAVTLKKHGHDVCVLEKAPVVGGLAKSYRINGYTFDYGPHFLFGPKVYDLIREEFPAMALHQVESTKEKMYFKGKYFNFPFDPKNILLNMDRRSLPGVLYDMIVKRMIGPGDGAGSGNVEEWVVQAVGKHIYDYISLGGYIEKLYGLPATAISHEWGMQKLKFLARWRDANLIKLAIQSFSEKSHIKKRVIHYPPGGIDHIACKIFDTLRDTGGRVDLKTKVLSVEPGKGSVSVAYGRDGKEGTLSGDFLISTIPITHLIEMLKPAVPIGIREHVKQLRYRTLLLLYLFGKRDFVLKDQCIYFTEAPFFFRRITEFKHLDRSMAPVGKTSLCIEVTCFDGDDKSNMTEADIFRIVTEQLDRGGYLKRGEIEGFRLLRIPFAYPVYELEATEILDGVLAHLKSYKNMISIGRQGLFFYNAMNSSILMSHKLGEKLARANRTGRAQVVEKAYEDRVGKYRDRC